MTLIQIQKLIEKLPQNPVPKSGLKVEFLGELVLFDCITAKPVGIEEAKEVASWLVSLIGGKVEWEDKEECNPKEKKDSILDDVLSSRLPLTNSPKPSTPKVPISPVMPELLEKDNRPAAKNQSKPIAKNKTETQPKKKTQPKAIESGHDHFFNIIKAASSFKDLCSLECGRIIAQCSPYSPVNYTLQPEDQNRVRRVTELSESEKRMITEDKFLVGLSNKQLEKKYGVGAQKIKDITNTEICLMGTPREYKPVFVKRKDISSIAGVDYHSGIQWAGVDNKKLKRLSSIQASNIIHQDKARVGAGLDRITIKIRTCLACGDKFESAGARTCGCTSERRSGYILEDRSGTPL